MWNSGFEGHTLNASEAPGPELRARGGFGQRHTIGPTPTFFRKVCSEDRWLCLEDSLRSDAHSGLPTKPCLSNSVATPRNSPRHPTTPHDLKVCGSCGENHAQWAAGAILSGRLKPRPPMRMASDAMLWATSWSCRSPESQQCAHHPLHPQPNHPFGRSIPHSCLPSVQANLPLLCVQLRSRAVCGTMSACCLAHQKWRARRPERRRGVPVTTIPLCLCQWVVDLHSSTIRGFLFGRGRLRPILTSATSTSANQLTNWLIDY